MENSVMFNKIISELKLGTLIAQPQRVSGGYLHKMYCLRTTSGKYAVKLLNPEIMKRPDVFQNYQTAERLEKVLQKNNIPIVPAMEINNRRMQCIEKQYFYIFKWVEGSTLEWKEIKKEHCEIVGSILAKIHKIEQSDKPTDMEEICIDWDSYISMANTSCPEIAGALTNCRELLYIGQEEYNTAIKNIPAVTCICDSDMDSKNVMWVNGDPFIIDLECLGYGNPFWEMYQHALSWSGDVICRIDNALLKVFITSYKREYGEFDIDWNVLHGSGYKWLD